MELTGHKVVVIGGSSGIGLAAAQAALDEGAEVVIAGRSQEKLERARDALGRPVLAVATDMADFESMKRLFEAVGTLDHLFVSAGTARPGLVAETEMSKARPVLERRFWGCYNATHFAAPRISQRGSITYMSGNAAVRPMPGGAVGSAAVAAVEAFARGVALELKPVRVNVVRAGLVDTPMLDGYGERRQAIVDAYSRRAPAGRIGRPDEIAAGVIYLMKNEYTTGTVLQIDGGGLLV